MVRFVVPYRANSSFNARVGVRRHPVVVRLSVHKIEVAWRKQGEHLGYVGSGGFGGKIHKYIGVKEWLEENDYIDMPLLDMRARYADAFRFNDGRHTFSFLRDSGLLVIECAVPEDMQDVFLQSYGADD